jgi:hypothetical protein
MRQILLATTLALATSPAVAQDSKNVLTILTAPEPQTQLMAMVLTLSAAQKGVPTRILLCGPAGDIALKDAPETATAGQPPRDMSPQGLMRMMMAETGTTVEVCAIYLPGKGLAPSALIEGVGVAQPPAVAEVIVSPQTQVMSF